MAEIIGKMEHLILLAVLRLRGDGYGVTIYQELRDKTGKDMSIGALYTTLERLERKGMVASRRGEPTAERGGRAKRHFKVTGKGVRALEVFDHEYKSLRTGLRLAEAR